MMHDAVDGRSLQYLCIQLNVNLQISTLFHGFSVKFLWQYITEFGSLMTRMFTD